MPTNTRIKRPKILFAAAEASPMAKAGGLADVVGSLPKALRALGADVRIVLPFYRQINRRQYNVVLRKERFVVRFDGIDHVVRVFETRLPNSSVPVYLFDHPHYEGAGDIYYQDVTNPRDQQILQVERFVFFARALPEFLRVFRWAPDVIHCHDWHAAAIPLFLSLFGTPRAKKTQTLYTIHNLPLQGSVALPRFAELLGVHEQSLPVPSDAVQNHTVNLTALALLTTRAITTVSPTYAREIVTPLYGGGLDRILRKRQTNLIGILNGIDTDIYNPAHDPSILPYSKRNVQKKQRNVARLQKRLGLDAKRRPIFGMVTRLTSQKGVKHVCDILPRLVQLGCAVVVLGAGEPDLEKRLCASAQQHKGCVSVTIGFDPILAQQIYAGSDCFLMPSAFEPCGLGQMIAMRYGTIPIVRATGGLRDSVREGKTGLVFQKDAPSALLSACLRARSMFLTPRWCALQRHAMEKDFSWRTSARRYLLLYQNIIRRA